MVHGNNIKFPSVVVDGLWEATRLSDRRTPLALGLLSILDATRS